MLATHQLAWHTHSNKTTVGNQLTYHSSSDQPWQQTGCSNPITSQHEAQEDEGHGEPEVVIGLWTLHHLDGARLLTPHGLELHHVGCVGGHAGEGGPLLWGVWCWLVGGQDKGRIITLVFLYTTQKTTKPCSNCNTGTYIHREKNDVMLYVTCLREL